jgi:hypothetical protein
MAGMDSEQIIGSCNAAGMHFLQDRAEYSGGVNGNLAGIDTFTIFEAQRHGGDGQ